MADNSPFSKLDHVGIIVGDLDKAVEHLQSLGIGPFKSFKKVDRQDTKLYGKPIDPDDIKLGVKVANIGGDVKIELIQPLGEGPWREFLDTRGDGIHHLAFAVDDINKVESELVKRGLTVFYHMRLRGGGGAAYLDAGKLGGIVETIEIVQWAPGMTE